MLNKKASYRIEYLLALCFIALSFSLGSLAQDKQLVFDPNGRKFDAKRGVRNPGSRAAVLDDFIRQYKLVGLSRAKIHALLGIEGISTEPNERLLIRNGGCIDPSKTYLEIEYDTSSSSTPNSQKALRYRQFIEHFDRGKPEVSIWCQ
jgi:hypothetical protein